MIRAKTESPVDVIRWMQSEAVGLWPALLGSLSFRRSRCMQANCAACLSGADARGHVLYGRHNGRRFAVYVPEELVGEVRSCVDNGRAGAAGAIRAALCQGVEAPAHGRIEEQEGLSRGASGGTADQFCGYRIDTAG